MNFSKRAILILIILISCVGCDQATKSIAVSKLSGMDACSYLGDTLRLQLTYNRGAFLSLGHSLPESLRHSIFTVGIGFFLIGALAFTLLSKDGTFPVMLAVSLIVAGGVGNLMDRIMNDGVVVDFLNVGIGPLRTGIFNMADVAVMGGAIILLSCALRNQKQQR